MQGSDLSFLNTVDLDAALRIRKESRPEGIRSALRKAWKANLRDGDFDESNAIELPQLLAIGLRDYNVPDITAPIVEPDSALPTASCVRPAIQAPLFATMPTVQDSSSLRMLV